MVTKNLPVNMFGNYFMTIEKRLKEERERLALSQTAFASAAGVVKQTVIQWEKGATDPGAEQLSLLHAIGVDLQYVLLGIRSPKDQPKAGITLRDEQGQIITALEQERAGYGYGVLNEDEQLLVENFRACTAEGKVAVKATSASLAQLSKKLKAG